MAIETQEQLDQYIALIEQERERRPAEAALADEIKRLRNLLWATRNFLVPAPHCGPERTVSCYRCELLAQIEDEVSWPTQDGEPVQGHA